MTLSFRTVRETQLLTLIGMYIWPALKVGAVATIGS